MTQFPDWYYKGKYIKSLEDVPEGMTHFVYEIYNMVNHKRYVGQKGLYSKAKYKVKAKTTGGSKTRRSLRESDWLTYCGSSGQLTEDIKFYGKDKFERAILHWADGKACANYIELAEQMKRNVLFSDDYYNGIVNIRISGNQIKNSKVLQEFVK